MKTYYKVLTIAGSDSGGGAGIQADLKTFCALGCYGMSVITALTAQNTQGVSDIHPVPTAFVEKQIESVLSDIGTDAVKIGMLFSVPLIESVALQLNKFNPDNIVLDPVMVAQSGDKLLKDDAVKAIQKYLMPLADIVTPNLPEAEALLNRKLISGDDIRKAASELALQGSNNVLIKGGHKNEKNSTDILYQRSSNQFTELSEDRIKTNNNHGTGCTLSSAIAAFLAKGFDMENAVKNAKVYITKAIQSGKAYKLGAGHGPVHHFFNIWN